MKKQKLQRRLLAYFALVAFLPVLTIMGYYIILFKGTPNPAWMKAISSVFFMQQKDRE